MPETKPRLIHAACRLPVELVEAVRRQAQKEDRSVAAFFRRAIIAAVEAKTKAEKASRQR